MIKIDNLSINFKNKMVFNNNEFYFKKSSITSLVGMNGSGKTTLIQIMLGIIQSDNMNLWLENDGIFKKSIKVEDVFYIPSDFTLPEYLTGREYINFVLGIYKSFSQNRLDLLIELLTFKEHLDKLIDSYSYGMKKKLQMILTFSLDVKILIFDEIHSGLDVEASFIFNKLIRKRSDEGVCVIIATHDIHYASTHSDTIYLLKGEANILKVKRDELEVTIENIILGEKNNDRFNDY